MDVLGLHEISEAGNRILNPITAEKLALLGDVSRLHSGMRLLDLACGKGEMLCQWATTHDISGIGVDISEVFIPAAIARAESMGVADRLRFVRADASTYVAEPSSFDVVSCLGATWIGGGLAGTIDLMRPALVPGGLMLVGEPFWREEPPQAAYEALDCTPRDFTSLAGTLDRVAGAGMKVVEMVLADEDSWDRYEAAQWWTLTQWLDEYADSHVASEVADFLDRARRSYVMYGRRYLGWGVFVLRSA